MGVVGGWDGSEITSLQFRDIAGRDLPDYIPRVKHTSLSWSPLNDGIFYSVLTLLTVNRIRGMGGSFQRFTSKKPHAGAKKLIGTEKDEYHSLFFHKIGVVGDEKNRV